jgi:2-oxoisovalerate dehydrogenase E2 component (dihydrolipoyl transacylase)
LRAIEEEWMAQITMPTLGESVTEGTIGRWLKQPGEHVERDEPLVEVTTDKVNTEMPAPFSGTLRQIVAQEGMTVAVGAEIAIIAIEGEALADAVPATQEAIPAQAPILNQEGGEGAGPAGVVASTPPSPPVPTQATGGGEEHLVATSGGKRRYTPVVLRLAEEHGIGPDELARIPSTGLGGRVGKDDILRHIATQGLSPRPQAAIAPTIAPITPAAPVTPPPIAQAAAPAPLIAPAAAPAQPSLAGEVQTLTPMRRAIAEHMVRSVSTAPHAWMMIEVDMTPLVRHRAAQKERFRQREGFALSYVPFVIEATVAALQAHPVLNASFVEGGIALHREINVGVAVALEGGRGLVVPTIKGADGLSRVGLARAVNDIAERARANRLTADDLAGGTFTVNNTGSYGSVLSQPIINQPQAAILTMETIVKRPVVVSDPQGGDDLIAVRSLMNMCLSFDHRILDGRTAGQFLGAIKARLEGFDATAG